jgi:hypothetical protein
MNVDEFRKPYCFLLLTLLTLASQPAFPQTPSPVTVSVMEGGTAATYQIPWYPGMSVLNALEQALPGKQGVGSLSLNYFPEYGGYFVSAVGGVPAPGVAKFWATCLLPVGRGSTVIALPLAPNKILVGSGDNVILAYDQNCPGASSSKQ